MNREWTRERSPRGTGSLGRLGRIAAVLAVLGWLAPAAFAEDFTGDAAKGEEVYQGMGTCWTCHGKEGEGNGPAGAALQPPPRNFVKGDYKFDANKDGTPGDPEDLFLVIKNGAAPYGGNASMTPWGHLGDEAIKDVVAYLLSLKS